MKSSIATYTSASEAQDGMKVVEAAAPANLNKPEMIPLPPQSTSELQGESG